LKSGSERELEREIKSIARQDKEKAPAMTTVSVVLGPQ
jgi:hypothetical protein